MNKIKELYNKTKQWIKNHKKIIIGGVVGTAAIALGAKVLKKSNKSEENNNEYDSDNIDYGRDCIMKFVVNDDTQEVLGEVPCTELYAKEEIDIFNSNK